MPSLCLSSYVPYSSPSIEALFAQSCKAELEGGALRFLDREMNLAPVVLDDTAGDRQSQSHC